MGFLRRPKAQTIAAVDTPWRRVNNDEFRHLQIGELSRRAAQRSFTWRGRWHRTVRLIFAG